MFFNSRAFSKNKDAIPDRSPVATLATLATHQTIKEVFVGKVAEVAEVASNENVEIDVPKALNRSLEYLTRHDEKIGSSILDMGDIRQIESGKLPLENAKRYLERMEQQFPHLQSGERNEGEHPLLKALDELKRSGIELVQDDRRYIRERIGHRMNWAYLLDGYKRKWLAAMEGCPPHQSQNRGRFAANTWLREVAL